jgi:penicillin-binding protein 1A
VEDRRFYEHYGADFAGIGRAAWEDLQTLTVSQGGWTITEQLMKNLYISEGATGQRLALAPPGAGYPRFRL